MTEEVVRLIWTFVYLLMASSTISLAIGANSLFKEVSRNEQAETNSIAIINEYRQFNVYDNNNNADTLFYPQDIISAIMRHRGDPEVEVRWGTGSNNAVWCSRVRTTVNTSGTLISVPITTPANYTLEDLTSWFEEETLSDKKFTSRIIYDNDGSVARLTFTIKS